jgi:ABC-2 type transport system ATP-binding protein
MPDYAIRTRGLTKVFTDFFSRPRVVAVNDLTLNIERGEVFGLLGPNGSGKTTTIKMLLGFLRPSKGAAEVLGRHPGDTRAKRSIGFLPEESYFYRFLSGREILHFYARLFGMKRAERKKKVERLLEMVGLTEAADRRIGEYSKGMQRRIGIAQALINDPQLIIMDEPTSGLDPMGRVDVKNLILDLKEKGATVMLCSHLLSEVENVCTRVAVLHEGRLLREGTVKDLLERKGAFQVRISSAGEVDKSKIADALRNVPAKVDSVEPVMDTLEDVFMRIIEEGKQRDDT